MTIFACISCPKELYCFPHCDQNDNLEVNNFAKGAPSISQRLYKSPRAPHHKLPVIVGVVKIPLWSPYGQNGT